MCFFPLFLLYKLEPYDLIDLLILHHFRCRLPCMISYTTLYDIVGRDAKA